MKRVEYFPKKMAEREAALVARPPDSYGPIQVVR